MMMIQVIVYSSPYTLKNMVMKFNELPAGEIEFSSREIDEQIQRILLDPAFVMSNILKSFLLFIVEQTLSGHSDWLKEYTIAVNVLNKSSDFKPRESGIVRIHAGRLRRALHHYYHHGGARDPIIISIPKGAYVPVFSNIAPKTIAEENIERTRLSQKHFVIAVLPFKHLNNDLSNSFTDGLCMQLSNELMHLENFSVVAYQLGRHLLQKNDDVREVASIIDAQYIVTGDIQSGIDRIRINVQII